MCRSGSRAFQIPPFCRSSKKHLQQRTLGPKRDTRSKRTSPSSAQQTGHRSVTRRSGLVFSPSPVGALWANCGHRLWGFFVSPVSRWELFRESPGRSARIFPVTLRPGLRTARATPGPEKSSASITLTSNPAPRIGEGTEQTSWSTQRNPVAGGIRFHDFLFG